MITQPKDRWERGICRKVVLAEVRGRYEGGWVERICRYEIVNKQVYLIIIIINNVS